MKHLPRYVWVVVAFSTAIWAKEIDVVIIGLTGGGAPAIEGRFDGRLREELSVEPNVLMADYQQSLVFRHKIRFDDFPAVSRKLVESMKQYCSDSTMFVWGAVKECSCKPKRVGLFRSVISGEIAVALNVYSLRYKEYAFAGDVRCSFEKPNGFFFFGSIEDETHITATDRAGVINNLVDSAARKSAFQIATVLRGEKLRVIRELNTAGLNKYEVPSVSDLFNLPSVEGASLNKGRTKPKTPADSAKGAPGAPQKGAASIDTVGGASSGKR